MWYTATMLGKGCCELWFIMNCCVHCSLVCSMSYDTLAHDDLVKPCCHALFDTGIGIWEIPSALQRPWLIQNTNSRYLAIWSKEESLFRYLWSLLMSFPKAMDLDKTDVCVKDRTWYQYVRSWQHWFSAMSLSATIITGGTSEDSLIIFINAAAVMQGLESTEIWRHSNSKRWSWSCAMCDNVFVSSPPKTL